MINCPNKSYEGYTKLVSRVGNSIANVIWHKTEGNINSNGLPIGKFTNRLNEIELRAIEDSRWKDAYDKSDNIRKPSDRNIKSQVFGGKNSVTAGEALSSIINSNPRLASIASSIKNVMQRNDLNVVVELKPVNFIPSIDESGDFVRLNGGYNDSDRKIEIAEFGEFQHSKDGSSHNCILHEIIHAITYNYIVNNPNSEIVKELKTIYNHAVSEIAKKYNISEEEATNKYYGLKNHTEFISEAFTKAPLISELLQIKSIGSDVRPNVFVQLYEWIASLFGVKNTNLYDDFLSVASDLMLRRRTLLDESDFYSGDFSIENYDEKQSRLQDNGWIRIDKNNYYKQFFENPKDLVDWVKDLGFTNIKVSEKKNFNGNKVWIARISDNEIYTLNSISIENVEDIKNSDNDYIVRTSDNTMLSTSEVDAAIGSILGNFYDLTVKDGNTIDVKKVFRYSYNSIAKAYNKNIEKYENGDLTAESNINSLDKILDKTAWDKLTQIALKKLQTMGISVRGNKLIDDDNKQEFVNAVDDEYHDSDDSIDADAGGIYGENWNNNATLSTGDMDTSSRIVKMLMWSLRDTSKNSAGLATMVDVEDAYRRILNVTSISKDRTIDGILESINDEANIIDKYIPNNIFRQLYNKLQQSDLQTRIQFVTAMNRKRNVSVMNSWNSNYSTLGVFSSENRSANKVVLSEWKTFITHSLSRDKNIRTDLINKSISKFEEARNFVKNNPKMKPDELNEKLKSILSDALSNFGIKLSEDTYTRLYNSRTYTPKLGYTFKGKGSFSSQFSLGSTGNPNGIFSALEVELKKIKSDDSLESIIKKFDQSAFDFLANIESKSSNKYFANMTVGVDGNARYNFGINTSQTNISEKLLNSPQFVDALRESIYTGYASWLKDKNFGGENTPMKNFFKIVYSDGIRKSGSNKVSARKAMVLSEDILSRLSCFQNNGKDTMYLWDTTKSDKHMQSMFEVPRTTLDDGIVYRDKSGNVFIDRDKLIDSDILDDAFGIVRADASRILSILTMSSEEKADLRNRYGVHYDNNGQFFYGYKFLNGLFKFNENLDIVPEAMIDVNGESVKTSDLLTLQNESHVRFLKEKIADYYISKIDDDIQKWESNGLITKDDKGSINNIPMNYEYAKKMNLGSYEIDPDGNRVFHYNNKDQALKYLSLDMSLNSQIAIHNSIMLFSEDPASIGKSTKNFINKAKEKYGVDENNTFIQYGIDDAMAEYQKRLAKDIAPNITVSQNVKMSDGTMLPQEYNVIFTSDLDTDGAKYVKSLSKSLNLKAEDVTSKGTDALEFVTFQHKLMSLFRYGQISESDYTRLLNKYSKDDLSSNDIKFIIGAGKPVQVPVKFVDINGKKFYKLTYIKSAEMPLIRQITKTLNGGLDGLREAMEKNDIDRVVHVSAAKIGAENIVSIYGDDKNFLSKSELSKLFKSNSTQLDWGSFGYQQDLPYDEEHDSVRLATQAEATILTGVQDKTFKYRGREIDGKNLNDIKNSIRTELANIAESELDRELSYHDNKIDNESILKTLDSSASRLKWPQNDIIAVRNAIKNKLPLLFSPISSKLESVLLSKYSNDVIKQKQPGGSFVQFPHVGKGIEGLDSNDINNINGVIKTKYYDPGKGLQYYSSEDGKVTLVDIMVPFKFWDNKKLLDIKNFVGEDGLLDLNKVPEHLLRITGLRIPNQGHSSQALCRIVGFLPAWYGDIAIVPQEITTQMGSDFDIDKLYSYWRNSFLNSDGNIESIPDDIITFDDKNNIVIGYNKLSEWRYRVFSDKFENKRRLADHLKDIRQLDELGLSLLRQVSDLQDKSESQKESDINSFLDYKITYDDAKEIALKDLGLTQADVTIPTREELVKKAIEDAYFDIFDSVLSHPDVVQKAMTPLDKPDLEFLASEVKPSSPKKEFGDYMRQAGDYIAQSANKSGVGAMSKVVVGLAKMENKDIKFVKLDGNGNYVNEYFSKFTNHNGETLNLYRLDPNTKSVYIDPSGTYRKRTGIENVISQQTGFVDGANKPVAYQNNLNSVTFNVSAVLSALSDSKSNGVALDTNTRFLRQEGIRMLTDLISESKGTITSYEESVFRFVSNATKEIENRLASRYKGSREELNRYVNSLSSESYSPSSLKELEEMEDKNSLEYIGKQIDLVRTYKTLDDMAWVFSDATTLGTFDSKGLGSSYYENELMLFKAGKAVMSGRLQNASKVWSNNGSFGIEINDGIYSSFIDDSDKITSSGNNYRIAAKAQNAIGNTMGYNNEFLLSAISKIENNKGLTNSLTKNRAKLRKTISNAFKSFVYSRLPILKDFSLSGFIENSKLANDLVELKSEKDLSSNLFIQSLQSTEDLKHIFMDSNTTDSSMAAEVVRGFYELATSDNSKYRDFAENIIKYQLAIGGVQSATSALKYIPADIIDTLGINKQVFNAINGGISLSDVDEFTQKFFQNNPEEATFVRDLKKKMSVDKTTGKKRLFMNVYSSSPKYIGNDTFSKITALDDNGDVVPKEYLRTSDYGKTRLYKFDETHQIGENEYEFVYDEIPLKGTASLSKGSRVKFSDYSGEYGQSLSQDLTDKNNVSQTLKPEVAPSKDSWKRLTDNIPHMSRLTDIKKFMDDSVNPSSNWISGIIDSMSSKLKDVKILYGESDSIGSASYNPKTKEITIFKRQISDIINSYGVEYAQQTLLHEISHAIMHEAYQLGKSGDPNFKEIYENTNMIFEDAKAAIKTMNVISIVTGEEIKSNGISIGYGNLDNLTVDDIIKIAKETFPSDVKLRNDLRLSLYSFLNPEEFMADLMSRPKFQQFMNTVKISDKTAEKISSDKEKSILRALLDQFKKLFSRLNSITITKQNGQKDSINNILEASFVNTMILVDKLSNKTPKKESVLSFSDALELDIKYGNNPPFSISIESQSLPSTISDFLRKSDKDVRFAFRNAIEKKLFSTKCE